MIRPAPLAGALAAAVIAIGVSADRADSDMSAPAGCAAPSELTAIGPALARGAGRIERGEKLTIVAVGSSSTQGVGASAPGLSYPSRLEAELRQRFPEIEIDVINRGKSGEDAPEELARLDRDVLAAHPDLVIWQLGTNAVLRRDDVAADGELIRRGLAALKDSASDVVLMDMQYAPRVVARPVYAVMEQLIAQAAKSERVGFFRRFEIMRHWHAAQPADSTQMVGPDGLHMTDRGYGCLAAELAEALAANWSAQLDPTRRLRSAAVARPGERRAGITALPAP